MTKTDVIVVMTRPAEQATDFRLLPPETLQYHVGQFLASLDQLVDNGAQAGEPDGLVAFREVVHEWFDYETDSPNAPEARLKNAIIGFVSDRSFGHNSLTATDQVEVFWRAIQFYKIHSPGYPYTTKPEWEDGLRSLFTSGNDYESLKELLSLRTIQSNIPERYAGLKIALNLYKRLRILPPAPSLCDVGCSAGLGQVQLESTGSFGRTIIAANPAVRKFTHRLLRDEVVLSANVGADIWGLDDVTLQWIESNSFYLSELTDPQKSADRQKLFAARRSMRLELVNADIALPDGRLDELRAKAPNGDSYDVVSAITMLYEMPEDEREAALRNIGSLASRMIYVQDFAELDTNNPTELIFHDGVSLRHRQYNAFVRMPFDPDGEWIKLGHWNNGRCKTFTPSPAFRGLYHAVTDPSRVARLDSAALSRARRSAP